MLVLSIAIVVASVAGVSVWVAWSLRRDRRRWRTLRPTPIRDLVGGERVRVIGIARKLDADVGGVYTGTVCLACHGWIDDSETSLTPPDDRVAVFRIEDDTGSVPISIEHVKLELTGTIVDVSKSKAFGSSIVARESRAAGSPTYWEDRLDADTRVAVIGYVVRGDDGSLRLAGRTNDPLVIANVSMAFAT